MATALTSTSLPSNSILELLPKLRPLDLSDNETCFSDGELTSEFDDCVSAHLETLAAKDKTTRDFLHNTKNIRQKLFAISQLDQRSFFFYP